MVSAVSAPHRASHFRYFLAACSNTASFNPVDFFAAKRLIGGPARKVEKADPADRTSRPLTQAVLKTPHPQKTDKGKILRLPYQNFPRTEPSFDQQNSVSPRGTRSPDLRMRQVFNGEASRRRFFCRVSYLQLSAGSTS